MQAKDIKIGNAVLDEKAVKRIELLQEENNMIIEDNIKNDQAAVCLLMRYMENFTDDDVKEANKIMSSLSYQAMYFSDLKNRCITK